MRRLERFSPVHVDRLQSFLKSRWTFQRQLPAPTQKRLIAPLSSGSRSLEVDFLERTRRRIWGTDQPPGADDPYTGLSKSKLGRQPGHAAEFLTVGGDEAALDADGNSYEQQSLREAREIYQQSVDTANSHPQYNPATIWDGLEMVGGEHDWNGEHIYQGFRIASPTEDPDEIVIAIHQAAVEVFLSASAGESLTDFAIPQGSIVTTPTQEVKITTDGETVKLNLEDESLISRVVSSIKGQTPDQEDFKADRNLPSLDVRDSPQEIVRRLGREWLHVPLCDSRVKFAIVRRIMQLTGIHISDHLISEADSISFLVLELTKRPKPSQLVVDLQAGPLSNLSNVRIATRRETPIDKEMRIGGWKVIEKELVRKNLPVVGRW